MAWKADYLRLFISHINPHRQFAANLKVQLLSYGVDAFVAHDDIEPSLEWQNEIEIALKSMDALIALLCPGFQASNWADQEVGIGLGRERLVLAIRCGLDPYGFLGKIQGIQGMGRTESQLANDIFTVLAVNPKTSVQTSRGAIEALYHAESFRAAKDTMSYVERCLVFSPAALARMQSALHDNGQVSAAYGVPERVAAIVANHNEVF